MPSLSAVRAANAAFKPSYIPVAVFVGGTSGIGQGMAEAFARHTGGRAHIVLVGRNKAAADKIISNLPKGEDSKYEFLECDLTLVSNVLSVVPSLPPKINYLALSAGFFSTAGFTPTSEGLDRKLAVHYYSRFAFIKGAIPNLLKAKEEGEDAKVVTILAAGNGAEVDLNDLGLKKTYSITKAGLQAPSYNDIMVDELARRYPTLSFTHTYPGYVRTGVMTSADNAIVRNLWPAIYFLTRPISLSYEESGEYQIYNMIQAKYGENNRRGSRGEDLGLKRYFGKSEEVRKKIWEHALDATGLKD